MFDGRGVKLRIKHGTYLQFRGPLLNVNPATPIQKTPSPNAVQYFGDVAQHQCPGLGAVERSNYDTDQEGTVATVAVPWTNMRICEQSKQTL